MLFDRIKNSKMFRPLLEEVRKQNGIRAEILKGMTFNSTIADSEWLKYKSFSPGLWAADYGLLYTLYRALSSMKPKSIVEFGLGQSSKIVHQYANYYQVDAVTFEHDPRWVDFFNEGRDGNYDIKVKLLDLETVQYKGFDTITYKGLNEAVSQKVFDFILVDGPFGSDHYSRSEVLDIARNNLAPRFCIIMDDTDRREERETAEEVMSLLKELKIDFCTTDCASSKKHTIIASADLKFLLSL